MSNKRSRPGVGRRSIRPSSSMDAVAMVLDEGRAIADVARVDRRERRARSGTGSPRPAGSASRARRSPPMSAASSPICAAENAQLRMERDLLKRSLAFWVKESTP